MIRQGFLNLHDLIPVLGTQTNTKFTGLAYITVKTEPGISVWSSECKWSLLAIWQTFLSAFLRLGNIVDLLKRENKINRAEILFIDCHFSVLNFQKKFVKQILRWFYLWDIFYHGGRHKRSQPSVSKSISKY